MYKALIVSPLLNIYVIIFESMEIAESIYEGVVETSYILKTIWADANSDSHSSNKRGEAALSSNCPENGERSGKRIKLHV